MCYRVSISLINAEYIYLDSFYMNVMYDKLINSQNICFNSV